jgi:hypothetical protein
MAISKIRPTFYHCRGILDEDQGGNGVTSLSGFEEARWMWGGHGSGGVRQTWWTGRGEAKQ